MPTVEVLFGRRRPVNLGLEQPGQALPTTKLDRVEYVTHRWHLPRHGRPVDVRLSQGELVVKGLGLRDLRNQRAVLSRDLGLDHDQRPAPVNRTSAGRHRALAHGPQEVRL